KIGTDREEFLEGMVCVAVPIVDQQKRFFATLSFHAPSSRLTLEEGLAHVPRLRQASSELTSLLPDETDSSQN
ncbi:MAG: IclR family transcriptional regulator C-terminal domain-containing protein, partial [SAR324 cluster bacterium]|nr:IclR family transcriptional regulator C-terminal domain-containing protein [SAR324 cluster bacterium]